MHDRSMELNLFPYNLLQPAAASMEVEDVVFRTFSAKNKRDRSSPDAFLGRKTTMFTPHLLASGNSTIPVYRTIQQPGEMIVTFPRAYQAAVSLGLLLFI